jgi:hypothetical protein
LLKLGLGMAAVFALLLVVLWYTQPWRPSLTWWEAALVMVLPSLLLVTHSLARPGGRDYYWSWPLLLLMCWLIAWKPLTSSDPWYWFGPHGWLGFALAGVATILFHKVARRRWLADDLPRLSATP